MGTFFVDGRAVRMANLVRGVAQLVLPRGLKAGSHTVQASYNGRGLLAPSSISQTIVIIR